MSKLNTNVKAETKPLLPAVFFLGIKIIKYRIVKDNYGGFECQKWWIWCPFWTEMGNVCNTHFSLDKAIKYIENDMTVVVVAS